ncbi:MAG: peptide MFS transporter [Calditrichaceae bacterium]|nr:peptide MFS transporter [Calditrichaceae bacterium]MBN2707846.1 peptide MFS transporter [Calditrichaceae bacterium]RQV94912.1 MAG: MFS transporter [Calditrichota bacterium]
MLKNHPKGLMTLFFTEMWERFGFYTMLAVFTLYMDETLGWSDAYKGQVYGLFLGFVYFTPIAGGWIADRFLGYRKTIIVGAVVLGLGYALLAFSGVDRIWLFYTALTVMVIGNGMFKANISVLVGNLYEPGSPYKDVGYNIFYMGINLGAFIAPLAATMLNEIFGSYNAAFAAAAIGMFLSLIVFEIWKKRYIHADNKHEAGKANQLKQEAGNLTKAQEKERILALGIIFSIIIFFWMAFHQNGLTFTLFAQRSTIDKYVLTQDDIADWPGFLERVNADSIPLRTNMAEAGISSESDIKTSLDKLNALLKTPELFFIDGKRMQQLPFEFLEKDSILKDYSLFGVYNLRIRDNEKIRHNEFAKQLDTLAMKDFQGIDKGNLRDIRIVNRELLTSRYPQIKQGYFLLNPETYATFNPFFILLLTPLLVIFFNYLNKRGKEPSTPKKMGIGMFITAIAISILVIGSLSGGNADSNSMGPQWLISMYFMITIGELFISPMGLSFVSKVAPARIRGMMMGFWFGATAVGNYLSGFIGGFYDSIPHSFLFGILVGISILAGFAVFAFLKKLENATRDA